MAADHDRATENAELRARVEQLETEIALLRTATVQTDNEAYALASCEGCTAVAVAFQVVLVVGEGAPLAPANIAVAASADCTSCLTWSTAVQLFVTLDGPLGEDATARLEDLWREVMAYAADIGSQPLDEIQARLTEFEEQVLAIVEEDQGPLGPTATPTGSMSSSPTSSGSASPTSPTASPSSSPSSTGSTGPSPTPTGTPTTSSPTGTPSTSSPSSTPTSGSASATTASSSPTG